MHEGGAEVLAWRAMQELDFLSREEFEVKICAAYRHCADQLSGSALMTAAETGQHQLLYSCGAVIGRLSELALQQRDSDIFHFWRQLIEIAKQDPTFSERTYFDVLCELSGNSALVDQLRILVAEDHNDTGTLLQHGFETLDATVPCDIEQRASH